MKARQTITEGTDDPSVRRGYFDITAKNFDERRLSYHRAYQRDHVMIRPKYDDAADQAAGDAALAAWTLYFIAKKMPRKLQAMRYLLANGFAAMAVCANPEVFDTSYRRPATACQAAA